MLQSSSELVWRRSKRGNNGNLQRDGNEQQAITIQFNEQGRVFSSSQIEITLGNFLVHDTAKFVLFLEPSRNTPPLIYKGVNYMNIKDLKKMLYNRKRMQKHVEKFTNGANDVDGDLTKFHKDMLESIVDSYEINTATANVKSEDIKELKEFDEALEEILEKFKKGGK